MQYKSQIFRSLIFIDTFNFVTKFSCHLSIVLIIIYKKAYVNIYFRLFISMINIMDYLSHFFLKFGHITFILPIVIICIIFHKRDIYAKATCFLLWVMIFNTLLKYLFKVPLLPHLGPGYAFPSGHMHAASAFYGYILYKTDNKFVKIGLATLLCWLGFSLIYCHFHDLTDVLGAIGFTIVELLIYHILSVNFGDKVVGVTSIITAVAIMFALNIIHKVEFHVWLAFYALVGMETTLLITQDRKLGSISRKLFALILSIIMIAGIYYLFKALAFDKFYLSEIRFALIPLIIVAAMHFSERIKV